MHKKMHGIICEKVHRQSAIGIKQSTGGFGHFFWLYEAFYIQSQEKQGGGLTTLLRMKEGELPPHQYAIFNFRVETCPHHPWGSKNYHSRDSHSRAEDSPLKSQKKMFVLCQRTKSGETFIITPPPCMSTPRGPLGSFRGDGNVGYPNPNPMLRKEMWSWLEIS